MYEVRALRVASTNVPGAHVYFQSHWDEWLPFAFYIWLIRGPDRLIVVDSAMPTGPAFARLQQNVREIDPRSEYQQVVSAKDALADAGVDILAVDDLIITNFVLHSTGGLRDFARARIHLSARGWRDYWFPEYPHPFDREVFFTPDTLAWLVTEAWPRVHLLDHEDTVAPGISTFWTGCHRRSSTAVSVETAAGRVVIFEPAFHFGNIERNVPIGGPESVADWYAAHTRAHQEIAAGGMLLPQHDPALLDRFPDGVIVGAR